MTAFQASSDPTLAHGQGTPQGYPPAPPSFINRGSFVSFEASTEVFESPSGGRGEDGGRAAPTQPTLPDAEVKATKFNQNKSEDVGYRTENWIVTNLRIFLPLPVAGGGCSSQQRRRNFL